MSFQWTLVVGVLYAEMAFLLILIFPFMSHRMWHKLFKSNLMQKIAGQVIYFYVLVALLIILLADAVREMLKYKEATQIDNISHGTHVGVEMKMEISRFRAQRNFYIAGFALFLSIVIKGFVSLICKKACLEVEKEAALKQAESASRAAQVLMSSTNDEDTDESSRTRSGSDEVKKENEELKEKVETLEKEVSKSKTNVEIMKRQAENLSTEYDRLSEQYNELERKVKFDNPSQTESNHQGDDGGVIRNRSTCISDDKSD